MAYCDATDVAALLQQNTYSSSSQPTVTQVNTIIDQRTAQLDSIMGRKGISLPITDSTALKLLEQYCSYGSACTVGMSYMQNANTVNDTQAAWYCDEFKEFVTELKEDPASVLNLDTTTNVIENQVTDGSYTEVQIDEMQIDNEFKW